MKRRFMVSGLLLGLALANAAILAPAEAQQSEPAYEFASPPAANINRIYRVNRVNGEIGACQFKAKEGAVGTTLCFPVGEGAGPQVAGDYGLIASNHEKETGVVRVNRQTGEMSVCYVLNEKAVCTAPAR